MLTSTNSGIDENNGKKYVRISGIKWFTNLGHKKHYEDLILCKKYYGNEKNYPKYDNYDAINVDKTAGIPYDYFGNMGVPITFFDKYSTKQFEILGCTESKEFFKGILKKESKVTYPTVGGNCKYKRILIRRRQQKAN